MAQKIGLADIAAIFGPARETVTIGSVEIEVRGLSGAELGSLAIRFPDQLERLIERRDVDTEDRKAFAKAVVDSYRNTPAMVAITAIGLDLPGDDGEAEVSKFGQQSLLLFTAAIIRLSYAEAQQRPFVEPGASSSEAAAEIPPPNPELESENPGEAASTK